MTSFAIRGLHSHLSGFAENALVLIALMLPHSGAGQ